MIDSMLWLITIGYDSSSTWEIIPFILQVHILTILKWEVISYSLPLLEWFVVKLANITSHHWGSFVLFSLLLSEMPSPNTGIDRITTEEVLIRAKSKLLHSILRLPNTRRLYTALSWSPTKKAKQGHANSQWRNTFQNDIPAPGLFLDAETFPLACCLVATRGREEKIVV